MLSWDLCVKGSFYQGRSGRGGRNPRNVHSSSSSVRGEASTKRKVLLGRASVSLWEPSSDKNQLFCFNLKNISSVLLSFGAYLTKIKKKVPLSVADTAFGSPQPLTTGTEKCVSWKWTIKKGHKISPICSLHSEPDKEHSMDRSCPRVAVGRGFSVISVCHDLVRGCGVLLFLLLLGWLAVCCRGVTP